MKKGFTLVELLVVIVIIGIISGMTLEYLTPRTAEAREVEAKADLRTIMSALELYYMDNGKYPDDTGSGDSDTSLNVLTEAGKPRGPYIRKLPFKDKEDSYDYELVDEGKNYKLSITLNGVTISSDDI